MGFLRSAAIAGMLSVAFYKGCEYLVVDKFKQVTGTGDPENTQIDTQQRFRGYGQEVRKGLEGFAEGVLADPNGSTDAGASGNSGGNTRNRTPTLQEIVCADIRSGRTPNVDGIDCN